MLAAQIGHVDIVRVLFEHNAEVNSQSNIGWTPLHHAVQGGTVSKSDPSRVVRLLLEHGANANARDIEHRTPLHLALTGHSCLDVARILLEHGADTDAENKKGWTPSQEASWWGQSEIVRLLSEFRSVRA